MSKLKENIYLYATIFWLILFLLLQIMFPPAGDIYFVLGRSIGAVLAPIILSSIWLISKKYRGRNFLKILWQAFCLFFFTGLSSIVKEVLDSLESSALIGLFGIALLVIQNYFFKKINAQR